ncbi:MAG: malonyl-[acyl-carrier protein] O-methyltransferase BioC [Cellvibrio sp. 79]|nr:MAG: malonyl-[acyl-carrier protein] O-methyltransferase BioC [Cellvibrio sp. 79]
MPNLILLHGWGCDSNTWQPILPTLEKIAQVAVLDLPGFGQAPVLNDFSLAALLENIAARIPDNSVVAGWSLGGMLGVQLANKYPKKVHALITLAANAKFVASDDYPNAMSPIVNDEFNESFTQDPKATLKLFSGLLVQGDINERQLLKSLRQQAPVEFSSQWIQMLELLAELDNRQVLAQLQQPCLHLLAEKDALVPVVVAAELEKINPAHKSVIIAQAAHVLHWSQPATVIENISSFLQVQIIEPSGLDKKKVAQSFGRAAPTYDTVAQLQRDVGKHLLQYIPVQLESGATVIDLGSGTGFFTRQLANRFDGAAIIGLDIAEGMLHFSQQQTHTHQIKWLCADAELLPLADHSVDLIFSSLAIQWCSNLLQLLRELARVLKPGGQLVVATLGPNTLHELKSAWQQADNYVHVNQFQPQDSLRFAAIAANLAIDHFAVEQRVIYFDRLTELTRELKALGAHNINAGKPEGLTGRSRIAAFKNAYEQSREARGLPATYEVFYLSVHKR